MLHWSLAALRFVPAGPSPKGSFAELETLQARLPQPGLLIFPVVLIGGVIAGVWSYKVQNKKLLP